MGDLYRDYVIFFLLFLTIAPVIIKAIEQRLYEPLQSLFKALRRDKTSFCLICRQTLQF